MPGKRLDRSSLLFVCALLCGCTGGPADTEDSDAEDAACMDDPCSTLGDSKCEGDAIYTCLEVDAACGPEWLLDEDCSDSDDVCVVADGEAECVAECPDTVCVADEVICDGDVVTTCEIDADGCAVVASTEDCSTSGQECVDGPPATCATSSDTVVVGDYVYTVVADLDSVNPGTFGPFQYLEQNPTLDPAADEPTVYFRATSLEPVTPPQASPAIAVYAWTETEGIELLAEIMEPIPGGLGGFTSFGQLVINPPVGHDGAVAFVGDGVDRQRGIYVHDAGTTSLVADNSFTVPGGAAIFTGLGEPAITEDEIVFLGTVPGGGGYYRWNDGDLAVFVDLDDDNPVADGNYTGVGLADFDGTNGIFFGYGVALPGATYTGSQTSLFTASIDGGAHQVLASKDTPMPDVDDQFTILTGGLFDGDGIYFHGRGSVGPNGPFGSIVHKGLYRWENGTIETVVNTTDLMPGSAVTFSADFANGITSQYMATHGGDLLYRGVGTVDDERVLYGIYLYRGDTGVSEKVIDTSDSFGGKVMTDILMSRKSFQGDHFTFWIKFDDGTQGIYLGRPLD